MVHRLINIALFIGFVVTMAYVGPAIDDNSAEHEVAREELAKAREQERFERGAQIACGPNAAWKLTHKRGEVVCLTKRGQKTKVVTL